MSHQPMVYVIDRDLLSRRSVIGLLARLGVEAWPFSSAVEFLDIADHLAPACILLCIDRDQERSFSILSGLADRQAGWPVIALSNRGDVGLAVRAMKLGALDFLEKPVAFDDLAAALVPAWEMLQQAIATSATVGAAQEQIGRLTPREVDIMRGLLGGQANKSLAHALGISVRTVEMHRAHMMAKLGVRSLAEVAVIATQAGVLPSPWRAATPPQLRLASTAGEAEPAAPAPHPDEQRLVRTAG